MFVASPAAESVVGEEAGASSACEIVVAALPRAAGDNSGVDRRRQHSRDVVVSRMN